MGLCLGSLAGCAGQACLCCACSKICSCCSFGSSKQSVRVGYLTYIILGGLLAVILRFWGGDLLSKLHGFVECPSRSGGGDHCLGVEAVYRVSFTLTIFFAVLMLLCALGGAVAKAVHTSFWALKLIFVVGLFIGTLFMPNSVFNGFAQASQIISAFFLLLQIIILIDFAYTWNESWVANAKRDGEDDAGRKWLYCILAASVSFFIFAFTLIVLMYVWFGGSGCGLNNFFISFTLICSVIVTALSVSGIAKNGAILTSAIVVLYITYLCWSAVLGEPDSCNTLRGESSPNELQLIVGMILAVASLSYSSFSAATNDVFHLKPKKLEVEQMLPEPTNDRAKREVEMEANATYFHLILALASIYMSMLLTDWAAIPSDNTVSTAADVSWVPVWVKMSSQWATIALYTWTLVAPALFPDRHFGPEED
eukprot:GILJ01007407.1.p1 GENE.GILJ01007407.1~~GILJ01007407.1.p1  ORF type:complete len:424 (-),score=61.54 GILJ01007407.1:201-1472(-)